MTKLATMKTTFQEESYIPSYAVEAFQEAHIQAQSSGVDVVFVSQQKLLKKTADGEVVELKDLQHAYVAPSLKHAVLKRRKKTATLV